MWGHSQGCPCGLCASLRRLFRLIRDRSATRGFILIGTLRLRNLLGELGDWLDQQERVAPPPGHFLYIQVS